MARSSKVDSCLICSETPCGCNKPAAAPKAKRAPKPKAVESKPQPQVETVPVAKPKISALDAMRARAAVDSQNKPPALQVYQAQQKESRARRTSHAQMPVERVKFVVPEETDDEAEFRLALEALAPLLHADELEKYKGIIPQPNRLTVSERAAEWRSRGTKEASS